MKSIADDWWNEDRRDLFRSLEVIGMDAPNLDRLGPASDSWPSWVESRHRVISTGTFQCPIGDVTPGSDLH